MKLGHLRQKADGSVRTVALLTLLVFTATDLLWADGGFLLNNLPTSKNQPSLEDIQKSSGQIPGVYTLPRELGDIKEAYRGSLGQTVVMIQDAHANEEAQQNIAGILNFFATSHRLNLVHLEGATGLLDAGIFSYFTDEEAKKSIADYYLKEARLTGPEYLALVDRKDIELFGVEEKILYDENRAAYIDSLEFKARDEETLKQLKKILEDLSRFLLPPEAAEFQKRRQTFHEKGEGLYEYINFLSRKAGEKGISLTAMPQLTAFLEASKLRSSIDFAAAEEQVEKLTADFQEILTSQERGRLWTATVRYRTGQLDGETFFKLLNKEVREALERTSAVKAEALRGRHKNMLAYLEYMELQESIDISIFDEITSLETLMKDALLETEEQRGLDRLWQIHGILSKLFDFSLTKQDADFFYSFRQEFDSASFVTYIQPRLAVHHFSYGLPEGLEKLNEDISRIEKFYDAALKRDSVLIENTLSNMKKKKSSISALITGGFHTPGMRARLREKGYSYLVITPRIQKAIDTVKENELYQNALKQTPLPLERMLLEANVQPGSATANDPRFQLANPKMILSGAGWGGVAKEIGGLSRGPTSPETALAIDMVSKLMVMTLYESNDPAAAWNRIIAAASADEVSLSIFTGMFQGGQIFRDDLDSQYFVYPSADGENFFVIAQPGPGVRAGAIKDHLGTRMMQQDMQVTIGDEVWYMAMIPSHLVEGIRRRSPPGYVLAGERAGVETVVQEALPDVTVRSELRAFTGPDGKEISDAQIAKASREFVWLESRVTESSRLRKMTSNELNAIVHFIISTDTLPAAGEEPPRVVLTPRDESALRKNGMDYTVGVKTWIRDHAADLVRIRKENRKALKLIQQEYKQELPLVVSKLRSQTGATSQDIRIAVDLLARHVLNKYGAKTGLTLADFWGGEPSDKIPLYLDQVFKVKDTSRVVYNAEIIAKLEDWHKEKILSSEIIAVVRDSKTVKKFLKTQQAEDVKKTEDIERLARAAEQKKQKEADRAKKVDEQSRMASEITADLNKAANLKEIQEIRVRISDLQKKFEEYKSDLGYKTISPLDIDAKEKNLTARRDQILNQLLPIEEVIRNPAATLPKITQTEKELDALHIQLSQIEGIENHPKTALLIEASAQVRKELTARFDELQATFERLFSQLSAARSNGEIDALVKGRQGIVATVRAMETIKGGKLTALKSKINGTVNTLTDGFRRDEAKKQIAEIYAVAQDEMAEFIREREEALKTALALTGVSDPLTAYEKITAELNEFARLTRFSQLVRLKRTQPLNAAQQTEYDQLSKEKNQYRDAFYLALKNARNLVAADPSTQPYIDAIKKKEGDLAAYISEQEMEFTVFTTALYRTRDLDLKKQKSSQSQTVRENLQLQYAEIEREILGLSDALGIAGLRTSALFRNGPKKAPADDLERAVVFLGRKIQELEALGVSLAQLRDEKSALLREPLQNDDAFQDVTAAEEKRIRASLAARLDQLKNELTVLLTEYTAEYTPFGRAAAPGIAPTLLRARLERILGYTNDLTSRDVSMMLGDLYQIRELLEAINDRSEYLDKWLPSVPELNGVRGRADQDYQSLIEALSRRETQLRDSIFSRRANSQTLADEIQKKASLFRAKNWERTVRLQEISREIPSADSASLPSLISELLSMGENAAADSVELNAYLKELGTNPLSREESPRFALNDISQLIKDISTSASNAETLNQKAFDLFLKAVQAKTAEEAALIPAAEKAVAGGSLQILNDQQKLLIEAASRTQALVRNLQEVKSLTAGWTYGVTAWRQRGAPALSAAETQVKAFNRFIDDAGKAALALQLERELTPDDEALAEAQEQMNRMFAERKQNLERTAEKTRAAADDDLREIVDKERRIREAAEALEAILAKAEVEQSRAVETKAVTKKRQPGEARRPRRQEGPTGSWQRQLSEDALAQERYEDMERVRAKAAEVRRLKEQAEEQELERLNLAAKAEALNEKVRQARQAETERIAAFKAERDLRDQEARLANIKDELELRQQEENLARTELQQDFAKAAAFAAEELARIEAEKTALMESAVDEREAVLRQQELQANEEWMLEYNGFVKENDAERINAYETEMMTQMMELAGNIRRAVKLEPVFEANAGAAAFITARNAANAQLTSLISLSDADTSAALKAAEARIDEMLKELREIYAERLGEIEARKSQAELEIRQAAAKDEAARELAAERDRLSLEAEEQAARDLAAEQERQRRIEEEAAQIERPVELTTEGITEEIAPELPAEAALPAEDPAFKLKIWQDAENGMKVIYGIDEEQAALRGQRPSPGLIVSRQEPAPSSKAETNWLGAMAGRLFGWGAVRPEKRKPAAKKNLQVENLEDRRVAAVNVAQVPIDFAQSAIEQAYVETTPYSPGISSSAFDVPMSPGDTRVAIDFLASNPGLDPVLLDGYNSVYVGDVPGSYANAALDDMWALQTGAVFQSGEEFADSSAAGALQPGKESAEDRQMALFHAIGESGAVTSPLGVIRNGIMRDESGATAAAVTATLERFDSQTGAINLGAAPAAAESSAQTLDFFSRRIEGPSAESFTYEQGTSNFAAFLSGNVSGPAKVLSDAYRNSLQTDGRTASFILSFLDKMEVNGGEFQINLTRAGGTVDLERVGNALGYFYRREAGSDLLANFLANNLPADNPLGTLRTAIDRGGPAAARAEALLLRSFDYPNPNPAFAFNRGNTSAIDFVSDANLNGTLDSGDANPQFRSGRQFNQGLAYFSNPANRADTEIIAAFFTGERGNVVVPGGGLDLIINAVNADQTGELFNRVLDRLLEQARALGGRTQDPTHTPQNLLAQVLRSFNDTNPATLERARRLIDDARGIRRPSFIGFAAGQLIGTGGGGGGAGSFGGGGGGGSSSGGSSGAPQSRSPGGFSSSYERWRDQERPPSDVQDILVSEDIFDDLTIRIFSIQQGDNITFSLRIFVDGKQVDLNDLVTIKAGETMDLHLGKGNFNDSGAIEDRPSAHGENLVVIRVYSSSHPNRVWIVVYDRTTGKIIKTIEGTPETIVTEDGNVLVIGTERIETEIRRREEAPEGEAQISAEILEEAPPDPLLAGAVDAVLGGARLAEPDVKPLDDNAVDQIFVDMGIDAQGRSESAITDLDFAETLASLALFGAGIYVGKKLNDEKDRKERGIQLRVTEEKRSELRSPESDRPEQANLSRRAFLGVSGAALLGLLGSSAETVAQEAPRIDPGLATLFDGFKRVLDQALTRRAGRPVTSPLQARTFIPPFVSSLQRESTEPVRMDMKNVPADTATKYGAQMTAIFGDTLELPLVPSATVNTFTAKDWEVQFLIPLMQSLGLKGDRPEDLKKQERFVQLLGKEVSEAKSRLLGMQSAGEITRDSDVPSPMEVWASGALEIDQWAELNRHWKGSKNQPKFNMEKLLGIAVFLTRQEMEREIIIKQMPSAQNHLNRNFFFGALRSSLGTADITIINRRNQGEFNSTVAGFIRAAAFGETWDDLASRSRLVQPGAGIDEQQKAVEVLAVMLGGLDRVELNRSMRGHLRAGPFAQLTRDTRHEVDNIELAGVLFPILVSSKALWVSRDANIPDIINPQNFNAIIETFTAIERSGVMDQLYLPNDNPTLKQMLLDWRAGKFRFNERGLPLYPDVFKLSNYDIGKFDFSRAPPGTRRRLLDMQDVQRRLAAMSADAGRHMEYEIVRELLRIAVMTDVTRKMFWIRYGAETGMVVINRANPRQIRVNIDKLLQKMRNMRDIRPFVNGFLGRDLNLNEPNDMGFLSAMENDMTRKKVTPANYAFLLFLASDTEIRTSLQNLLYELTGSDRWKKPFDFMDPVTGPVQTGFVIEVVRSLAAERWNPRQVRQMVTFLREAGRDSAFRLVNGFWSSMGILMGHSVERFEGDFLRWSPQQQGRMMAFLKAGAAKGLRQTYADYTGMTAYLTERHRIDTANRNHNERTRTLRAAERLERSLIGVDAKVEYLPLLDPDNPDRIPARVMNNPKSQGIYIGWVLEAAAADVEKAIQQFDEAKEKESRSEMRTPSDKGTEPNMSRRRFLGVAAAAATAALALPGSAAAQDTPRGPTSERGMPVSSRPVGLPHANPGFIPQPQNGGEMQFVFMQQPAQPPIQPATGNVGSEGDWSAPVERILNNPAQRKELINDAVFLRSILAPGDPLSFDQIDRGVKALDGDIRGLVLGWARTRIEGGWDETRGLARQLRDLMNDKDKKEEILNEVQQLADFQHGKGYITIRDAFARPGDDEVRGNIARGLIIGWARFRISHTVNLEDSWRQTRGVAQEIIDRLTQLNASNDHRSDFYGTALKLYHLDRNNSSAAIPARPGLADFRRAGDRWNFLTGLTAALVMEFRQGLAHQEGAPLADLAKFTAHTRNLHFILTTGKAELETYYRGINRPVTLDPTTRNLANRRFIWGEYAARLKMIEEIYGRYDLTAEQITTTLRDLVRTQSAASRKWRVLEDAENVYYYRLYFLGRRNGEVLTEGGQKFAELKNSLSVEDFFELIGYIKRVESMASDDLVRQIREWKTDPSSKPAWLTGTDLDDMLKYIQGEPGNPNVEGLKNRLVIDGEAVTLAIYFMLRQGNLPEGQRLNLAQARDAFFNKSHKEVFLQAIYMTYHTAPQGAPERLPRGDLAPYLNQIESGARDLDDIASIFKYHGMLKARVAEILPESVISWIERLRGGRVSGTERTEILAKLPRLTDTQLIGTAAYLRERQSRKVLGPAHSDISNYMDSWVRDSANVFALVWENSTTREFLPFDIVNSAVDIFREGEPEMNDTKRAMIRGRFPTIFSVDLSYRDFGDSALNRLRRLRMNYYVIYKKVLDESREAWWLDQWDNLARELTAAGVTKLSDIEALQREFLARMSSVEMQFMEVIENSANRAKIRDAAVRLPTEQETAAELEAFRNTIAPKIRTSLTRAPARETLVRSRREKVQGEERILASHNGDLQRKRQERSRRNQIFLTSETERQRVAAQLREKSPVPLTNGEITFLINKMAELGYGVNEALLRFIQLPRIDFPRIYRAATGQEIDWRTNPGRVSAFTDPIFQRWGYVEEEDADIRNVINGELNALTERGVTTVRNIQQGLTDELGNLRTRLGISLHLSGRLQIYGGRYASDSERQGLSSRVAADALNGGVSREDLSDWIEISGHLRDHVRNLRGDVLDREVLFRTDILLHLGIAELYEAPELRPEEKEQVKQEIRRTLSPIFNEAAGLGRRNRVASLLQSPTLLGNLAAQLRANPRRAEEIVDAIAERMDRQKMRVEDLRDLEREARRYLEVLRQLREDVDSRPVFSETVAPIAAIDFLEAMIFADSTEPDPRKRLKLIELILPDMPSVEVPRFERKVAMSVNEAFRQNELKRFKDIAPMPPEHPIARALDVANKGFENIINFAFYIAGILTLGRIVQGGTKDPLKGKVDNLKKWSPNQLYRYTLLTFNFLVDFMTAFLILWNVAIFMPYAMTFSPIAAVLFLGITTYLLRIFPVINLGQMIVYPQVTAVFFVWTIVLGFVFLGPAAVIGAFAAIAQFPLLLAAIGITLGLLVMTSNWFKRAVKSPVGLIEDEEAYDEVKQTGLFDRDVNKTIKELPVEEQMPTDILHLKEDETVVELRPWLPDGKDLAGFEEKLDEVLKKMAYSARGNNDRKMKFVLQMNGGMFNDPAKFSDPNAFIEFKDPTKGTSDKISYANFFLLLNQKMKPYWDEFTWTDEAGVVHGGHERLQIHIMPGGRKPTLAARMMRYNRWGEDGTQGKWWGQIEYQYRTKLYQDAIDAGVEPPEGAWNPANWQPQRTVVNGNTHWVGLPHLAIAAAAAAGGEANKQFYLVPPFMTKPFFSGVIGPDPANPFTPWSQAKEQDEIKSFEAREPNNSRVRYWNNMDDTNHFAPGGGLYVFKVMAKVDPGTPGYLPEFNMFQGRTDYVLRDLPAVTLWQHQGQTAHSNLWFMQRVWARLMDFLRLFGKYGGSINATDDLFAPREGFPIGLYFTRLWFFGGILSTRLEEFKVPAAPAPGPDTRTFRQRLGDGFQAFLDFFRNIGPNLMVLLGRRPPAGRVSVVSTQADVDGIFTKIVFGTYNSEDEIVSYTSEDSNAIWADQKEHHSFLGRLFSAIPFIGGHKRPGHPKARKMFGMLFEKIAGTKTPPIRSISPGMIERPDRREIIIDDRPLGLVFEFGRLYDKWIPSFDIYSWIAAHIARVVALSHRAHLLSSLVDRGLYSEVLFGMLMAMGAALVMVFYGYLEVRFVTAAWWLTLVILTSLMHSKITGPLFEKIERFPDRKPEGAPGAALGGVYGGALGFLLATFGLGLSLPVGIAMAVGFAVGIVLGYMKNQNAILRYLQRQFFAPFVLLKIIVWDGPQSIAELVGSNPAFLPQVITKPPVLEKAVVSAARNVIYGGAGSAWVPNVPETDTEPIWKYVKLYYAPLTIALVLGIPFIGAVTLGLATWSTAIIGVTAGIYITFTVFKSDSYQVLVIGTRDVVPDGKTVSFGKMFLRSLLNYPGSILREFRDYFYKRVYDVVPDMKQKNIDWNYARFMRGTVAMLLPLILLAAAGFFSHSLGAMIPLHWILLASPVLFAWLVSPFAGLLLGVHFKGNKARWVPYVNWAIGVAAITIAVLLHLPALQPFIGGYLELMTKLPMPIASSYMGADTTLPMGFLAPVLNVSTGFVFIHSLILAGEVLLLVMGFLYSIYHSLARWKKKTPDMIQDIGYLLATAVAAAAFFVGLAAKPKDAALPDRPEARQIDESVSFRDRNVLIRQNDWRVEGSFDTGPDSADMLVNMKGDKRSFSELTFAVGKEQIFSVKGNGYFRIRQPGKEWGTSFVLPGYWSGGRYFHNPRISDVQVSLAGEDIVIEGKMTDIQGKIGAQNLRMVLHKDGRIDVSFTLTALQDITFDADRLKNGEGLRVIQMSSMNIGTTWDADKVVYTDATGQRREATAKPGELTFPQTAPIKEGTPVLLLNTEPRPGRPTGSMYVLPYFPAVGQGYATASTDPNDDNWTLQLQPIDVRPSYGAGKEIGTFRFTVGPHTGEARSEIRQAREAFDAAQEFNLKQMLDFEGRASRLEMDLVTALSSIDSDLVKSLAARAYSSGRGLYVLEWQNQYDADFVINIQSRLAKGVQMVIWADQAALSPEVAILAAAKGIQIESRLDAQTLGQFLSAFLKRQDIQRLMGERIDSLTQIITADGAALAKPEYISAALLSAANITEGRLIVAGGSAQLEMDGIRVEARSLAEIMMLAIEAEELVASSA